MATGRRLRRLSVVACVATGLALASAPVASAKIWFAGIAGRTVTPGQLVRVFVPGCEAAPACGDTVSGIRIFISPVTSSQSIGTPPRPRWFVGTVDATGKLAFPVPRVTLASYRLVAYVTWGARPQFLPVSAAFTVARR